MVVMEYVEGMNAHTMLHSSGQRALPGPAGALAAVKRAVKLLHDQEMVHGDIRLGNVIIANPTAADEEDMDKRVRIVDFDWAGSGLGAVPALSLLEGHELASGSGRIGVHHS
ncbi:hypothetical protein L226DRAFT_575763 [Lentinus tigrinus ALCF2SS1-7]|uniref:Protein kinase domain-containing protein n=1 Tax=Lentinus tigrinus ALCF2SS1-6 TaxID=1328759 RepID=A0A5C2RTK2_9APHY|nr:hypothetical protein L227DRAFT_616243 [Lentinus tigrinus ALCF2SS1-6]RPD69306.1 hypothetical protein L226DRAFT_575763 [Lentinus tigrinus ALCF2SS1-7]